MFDRPSDNSKPAIVLVHGAWADASCWNGVIAQLQAAGLTVYAPPNPLRSLAADAATIVAFVKSIPGAVVLVGHSYGGAVISVASPSTPNVKALVYVDAFAPDEGESCQHFAVEPAAAAAGLVHSRSVCDGRRCRPLLHAEVLRRGFRVRRAGGGVVAHGGDAAPANG